MNNYIQNWPNYILYYYIHLSDAKIYLFSKNNANAKVNQIQTNPNFLVGGSNKVSKTSNPKIIPNVAPKLQKMMECHSNAICIQKMVNAAAVIPKKQN